MNGTTGQTSGGIGIGTAFAALGLLIGLLTGLTSSSVVSPLIGLMFAFVGGSVITFLSKFNDQHMALANKAVFCLSVACIVGVLAGVLLCEWQLLSPSKPGTGAPSASGADKDSSIAARKYLRDHVIPEADRIDQKQRQGLITTEQAYKELQSLVKTMETHK